LLLGSQELAAAKLQDVAADKQLIAARMQAGASNVPVGGTTTSGNRNSNQSDALAFLGKSAFWATVGSQIGAALGNSLGKSLVGGKTGLAGEGNFGVGDAALGVVMAFQSVQHAVVKVENMLGLVSDENLKKYRDIITELDKFVAGLIGANKILSVLNRLPAEDTSGTPGTTGGRVTNRSDGLVRGMLEETQHAVVSAFEDWQTDDARIVQEAAERRIQIVADAEQRIATETQRFASQVSSINANAASREASLRANFIRENAEAETRAQEQRADIIREGGEAVREILEQQQERVRKMTMQHDERVEELTASRDALGLAKERRRFNAELAESERESRQEIARRRQDVAERLAEFDRQTQIERAQRLVRFQEQLAENEAQREAELEAAAKAHAQELEQIRAARAQQLRELQTGLNTERQRRREMFLAQIRELDAALLGERSLRQQHYQQMLLQTQAFFNSMRAMVPTATAPTTTRITSPTGGSTGGTASSTFTGYRASGGYMWNGTWRVGEEGHEFALANRTTKAAESIIGGRLTQDALLNALANGAGRQSSAMSSVTWNDSRRYSGEYTSAMRRQVKRDTQETIDQYFG
jgi:hypothetical protein